MATLVGSASTHSNQLRIGIGNGAKSLETTRTGFTALPALRHNASGVRLAIDRMAVLACPRHIVRGVARELLVLGLRGFIHRSRSRSQFCGELDPIGSLYGNRAAVH